MELVLTLVLSEVVVASYVILEGGWLEVQGLASPEVVEVASPQVVEPVG